MCDNFFDISVISTHVISKDTVRYYFALTLAEGISLEFECQQVSSGLQNSFVYYSRS